MTPQLNQKEVQHSTVPPILGRNVFPEFLHSNGFAWGNKSDSFDFMVQCSRTSSAAGPPGNGERVANRLRSCSQNQKFKVCWVSVCSREEISQLSFWKTVNAVFDSSFNSLPWFVHVWATLLLPGWDERGGLQRRRSSRNYLRVCRCLQHVLARNAMWSTTTVSFELVFIVTCQYQPSTKYQHCVIQPIGRQIQLLPELLGVHHLTDFYHWKLEPDLISFNTIAATWPHFTAFRFRYLWN